jgi:hypothetical protein
VVIREYLRDHPELLNAHPKVQQRALREAYPFGERKMLPYRMWCKEVRLALYGTLERPLPPQPELKVEVTPAGVVCDWCQGAGCLACYQARQQEELTHADPTQTEAAYSTPSQTAAPPEGAAQATVAAGNRSGAQGER